MNRRDWIAYFEAVNERSPFPDEVAAAESRGDFVSEKKQTSLSAPSAGRIVLFSKRGWQGLRLSLLALVLVLVGVALALGFHLKNATDISGTWHNAKVEDDINQAIRLDQAFFQAPMVHHREPRFRLTVKDKQVVATYTVRLDFAGYRRSVDDFVAVNGLSQASAKSVFGKNLLQTVKDYEATMPQIAKAEGGTYQKKGDLIHYVVFKGSVHSKDKTIRLSWTNPVLSVREGYQEGYAVDLDAYSQLKKGQKLTYRRSGNHLKLAIANGDFDKVK